jgi:hydrocephalus-inducing protein
VKFPKTRIGKTQRKAIQLKNEGSIPATAKFDLTPNESFKFLDNNSTTLTPKSYGTFNILFEPK